jgi:hypothetical protein
LVKELKLARKSTYREQVSDSSNTKTG